MTAYHHKILTFRMSGNLNSTLPRAVLACTEVSLCTQGTFCTLYKELYFGCCFLGVRSLGYCQKSVTAMCALGGCG